MTRYNFPPVNPPGNNHSDENNKKKKDNNSIYFSIKNFFKLKRITEGKDITRELSKAEKQTKVLLAKRLYAKIKYFSEENPECKDNIYEVLYNALPFKKINLEIQHESFTGDGFTRFYFNSVEKDDINEIFINDEKNDEKPMMNGIIISDEILKFCEEIKKICNGLNINNKGCSSNYENYEKDKPKTNKMALSNFKLDNNSSKINEKVKEKKIIQGPDNLFCRYVISIKLGNGETKEKFWRQLAKFSKEFRDELLNRPKS